MSKDQEAKFVARLDCMDGRCAHAVTKFVNENYGFHFVDCITEPGMDKFGVDANKDQWDWIVQKLLISVQKHGTRTIFVPGHAECAGCPVSREKHDENVKTLMQKVASIDFGVSEPIVVFGMWISQASDDWKDWQAEVIEELTVEPKKAVAA